MSMKPLKNARHEHFARLVAKGEKYAVAYAQVYGCSAKSAETAGPRLSSHVEVRARVEYIKRRALQRTTITLASLQETALDLVDESVRAGQLSAAAQALKELGILSGHRIERRENRAVKDLKQLSDEELLAIIEAEKERQQPSPSTSRH